MKMESLQALGMLHTAMKNNHQDSFMILAMDQIHLSKELIEFLHKRRSSKKKITAFLGDYFFPFPAIIESSFYSAVKANTLNKQNNLSKFYYYNRDKTQILRWYDEKVFIRKR